MWQLGWSLKRGQRRNLEGSLQDAKEHFVCFPKSTTKYFCLVTVIFLMKNATVALYSLTPLNFICVKDMHTLTHTHYFEIPTR